jgi:hypothetical protein
MFKLWVFVGFCFSDGCTEQMLRFSIDTCGKMEFDAAVTCADLGVFLVVSNEVVRDDD